MRVLLASGAQCGRAVRFLLVTRGHHGLARPFVAPMSATSRPRSDTRRTCVLSEVTRFGSTETSGPRPFSPISSLGLHSPVHPESRVAESRSLFFFFLSFFLLLHNFRRKTKAGSIREYSLVARVPILYSSSDLKARSVGGNVKSRGR